MEVMSDHRENIVDSARSAGRDLASRLAGIDPETGEERDSWELVDEFLLSLNVWRDTVDRNSMRFEALLTCGGPTVSVEYDTRYCQVIYRHSWGRLTSGEDCTELVLCGEDLAPWYDLFHLAAETVAA